MATCALQKTWIGRCHSSCSPSKDRDITCGVLCCCCLLLPISSFPILINPRSFLSNCQPHYNLCASKGFCAHLTLFLMWRSGSFILWPVFRWDGCASFTWAFKAKRRQKFGPSISSLTYCCFSLELCRFPWSLTNSGTLDRNRSKLHALV